MKKLLIVESPAKSKTISKYLGSDYVVESSVGHIRDIPKSNSKKANAVDIENNFKPNYEVIKGKEKIITTLKREAKKADEVLLAMDPDREGEAIAWHIAEVLKLPNAQRVVFNEITEEAVQKAILHPRDIDQDLRKAQEARRVLDRLFGYGLSGLIWKKLRYGLSAGRVQSPALRILMERERLIRAFEPEDYWTITAEVKDQTGNMFSLICSEEPRDEKKVAKITKIAEQETWKILEIKETNTKRSPRAPFITSTLQQTASSRLGYSPSQTMMHAQRLYEAGYITYMRTDSITLSANAQKQAQELITKDYGKKYLEPRVFKSKSKNAQEAHEAIRPSNLSTANAGKTEEQQKLYSLIRNRTLASQMSDAKLLKTKIIASVGKRGKEDIDFPYFEINGSRLLFDGWLKIDPAARGEDVELPELQTEDILSLLKISTEAKQTTPPNRYSEASLIKELEKRGLGRPSTYATITRTLYDRGYVEKINKALHPTDTGDAVSSFLENHFENYISDDFTAEMENELDEVAEGKGTYEKVLTDFYTPFVKEIKNKEGIEKISNLGPAEDKYKCPKCGAGMVYKLGKSGKFISCEKFPDCEGALTLEGKEIEGPKETGEKCPDCKDGKLVIREGKFGKFVSCSNYPKCKFIKEDEGEKKKKMTGVKCPDCEDGEMMERRGRFGIFYSCSNYPKCKNAIKAKPTGKICDYPSDAKAGQPCGALMMEGTKTIPERCSNKSCPNHNPHKLNKLKE
ncbi:MAG: type I DNA topoisomerase [Candidatus Pacebacteria bacterium]|nr:type I DNA topoisomerase [Candidatus Paceibacterota bacterium]